MEELIVSQIPVNVDKVILLFHVMLFIDDVDNMFQFRILVEG